MATADHHLVVGAEAAALSWVLLTTTYVMSGDCYQ